MPNSYTVELDDLELKVLWHSLDGYVSLIRREIRKIEGPDLNDPLGEEEQNQIADGRELIAKAEEIKEKLDAVRLTPAARPLDPRPGGTRA